MLNDVQKFQADFNLHMVAAPMGLPVPPAAAALMIGAETADLEAYMAESQATVRQTSSRLLEQPDLASAFDRWPPPGVSRVMFVGDSITTYLYSYARLLAVMLDLRRPGHGVTFLNVAQSGYTSTHALEGTFTQFVLQQPDWVFIKLGVNDTKQFGDRTHGTLVPLDTYRSNLRRIALAFSTYTPARVVMLSPTPVVESISGAHPDFATMRVAWDNRVIRDFGRAVQEIAKEDGLAFVDLFDVFGLTPDPGDYGAGGLHPGPRGHERIATHLLHALSERA